MVAIGKTGKDVKVDEAMSLVWGYGVGVDLTRRDMQAKAKGKGGPWDMAKGFDFSAPMSKLVRRLVFGGGDQPKFDLTTHTLSLSRMGLLLSSFPPSTADSHSCLLVTRLRIHLKEKLVSKSTGKRFSAEILAGIHGCKRQSLHYNLLPFFLSVNEQQS